MRYLALTILLALTLAAPASAREHMTFAYARNVAINYWAKRNITVPCQPLAHVFTSDEDAQVQAESSEPVNMLADSATCTIDITPLADWYRTHREYAWIYCMEIVHEVGHLAGLEHEYGGVMDSTENIVPYRCDHLNVPKVKARLDNHVRVRGGRTRRGHAKRVSTGRWDADVRADGGSGSISAR